jgi:copper chaperone CopZ
MSVDGVAAAEVSFDKAQATVRFDPERVKSQDLIGAVEDAGFQARVIENPENR